MYLLIVPLCTYIYIWYMTYDWYKYRWFNDVITTYLYHICLPYIAIYYHTNTSPYITLNYHISPYITLLPYFTIYYHILPYITIHYHMLPYTRITYILWFPTADLLYQTLTTFPYFSQLTRTVASPRHCQYERPPRLRFVGLSEVSGAS